MTKGRALARSCTNISPFGGGCGGDAADGARMSLLLAVTIATFFAAAEKPAWSAAQAPLLQILTRL
jgi:hypothetical protein